MGPYVSLHQVPNFDLSASDSETLFPSLAMTEVLRFPSLLREIMARKDMLESPGKPNNISESGMAEILPWTLMKVPGQEPPPGQVSNFTDPPNLVITVAIVLCISSLFVSVAVGFRIESKVSSARSFTWDDCEYQLYKWQRQGCG